MAEIWAALVTATVGIIGAGGAFVVAWLNARKTEAELEAQKAEQERQAGELGALRAEIDACGGVYYVVCPSCGAKVYLSGAELKKDEGGSA